MQRPTRRSFLSAVASAAATPALGAPRRPLPQPEEPPSSGLVDAVVVGAGAAGIAAGRRLAAAGKRLVLLEASDRAGGRCITDTASFGVPYDRGAHWLYNADSNPVARFAAQTGLDLYRAPPGQRVRIGRRYAREGEMEDFLAGLVRASTSIAEAARKGDTSCAQVLPKDLGDWQSTVDFVLGPYNCGKDLSEISTVDLARSTERENSAFCRQGLGALLSKLATRLPLQLSAPVTEIDYQNRRGVVLNTSKGRFVASAAIITVSTNVLTSGKLRFVPELPRRHLDAAAKLKLGSYDHVALELLGNPLGLRADELVFEKSGSKQTASIFANVSGSSLCIVDVGGSFGRELSAKGTAAMVDFALSWLTGLYGPHIKSAVKRRHATRWNQEPWVLGASSTAAPGAQTARRIIVEPLAGRVFFAGEAAHETLWGTVGGAWETGERAADAVIRALGGGRRG
jgi:monoamine oxidase